VPAGLLDLRFEAFADRCLTFQRHYIVATSVHLLSASNRQPRKSRTEKVKCLLGFSAKPYTILYANGADLRLLRHSCSARSTHTEVSTVAKSPSKANRKTVRDGKSEFGKDRRRRHHHYLVTVNYADGETFGRVYTDKEKATKFAERQRRSPIVKSARVMQVS
jgi:hypothetical protein